MTKKQVAEKMVYLALHFQIIVQNWGKSEQKLRKDWDLEAGAGAGVTEESCLLHGFPWLSQFAFL